MTASSLTPMLTVTNAPAATDFYREAFNAVERARFTAPSGHVVAELAIDGLQFFVVDENPEAFNLSPRSLDGTTVRINLIAMTRMPPRLRRLPRARARSFPSPISPTVFGKGESPIPMDITGWSGNRWTAHNEAVLLRSTVVREPPGPCFGGASFPTP